MPAHPPPGPGRDFPSEFPPQPSETFGLVPSSTLPPAAVTASPSPCCSTAANEFMFDLSTTLTIPDYHRYYDAPIESFTPTYYALPDGSLITPPYVYDLKGAYSNLIFLSALTMVFFRNILVSGDYIRRGKVKKKGLFYLLFASQILGPVVLLPLLIAYFHVSVQCSVVFALACSACFVSNCILVTGILGFKAYLCLDRSRFIGTVLVAIQIVWLAIAIVDVTDVRSRRQLSGQCERTAGGMMPIMVILQCVQSFFISCCFMFAVWKSSGVPAVRGRISLQLSSMDHLDETPESYSNAGSNSYGEGIHTRRGWWDYAPESEKSALPTQAQAVSISHAPGFFYVLRTTVGRLWSREDIKIAAARKPSLHNDTPLPQPPRPPAVRISENPTQPASNRSESSRARSAPSFSSRHIGLRPRMVLLREVMRDELCYTTFITTLCVVVTVLAVVGVNRGMALNVAGWLFLNWAVVSLLAVHSFGRVVHRHEIEAMMQHPWSWDHSFRPDRRTIEPPRRTTPSGGPWSPTLSTASRRTRRNVAIGPLDRDPECGDSVEATMRLYPHSKRDDSMSISHSSLPSPAPSESTCGSSLRVPLHHVPGINHSPSTDEFHILDSGFNSSVEATGAEPEQSVFTAADLPFHRQDVS